MNNTAHVGGLLWQRVGGKWYASAHGFIAEVKKSGRTSVCRVLRGGALLFVETSRHNDRAMQYAATAIKALSKGEGAP